uniref:protein bicaudal C homolog 1-like n=1 Tax=Panthera onca TaxID=9690 RepID=UPI0029551395|nr:protein bicaudal C homolog 1-like [Panthera onca]
MESRAARRVHSARALLAGGGAVTGLGLGPGLGVAGGSRGWDAPGAPWQQRWRRRRRRPGDELAPRRGEPVEPGRRAEAAAQAERRPEPERRAPTMAAQGEPGYQAAQSDPGSNSERSTDSPMPGSEDDLVAGAPLHSPEWSEERFRVDRKKLEAMLQAAAEGKGKSGEDFFQKIMEETNTQIAWPSKLKIGAKSKKGCPRMIRNESAGSLSLSTRALRAPLWELPLLVQSSLEVRVLLLASELSQGQPSASEGLESENECSLPPFVCGTVVKEECGLGLKVEVNPEDAAAGDSPLATLLQMFYKFFLKGRSEQHPSAATIAALSLFTHSQSHGAICASGGRKDYVISAKFMGGQNRPLPILALVGISKSVIVKSVERNALNMYEARKCLLGLESSGVTIATSPSPASCPAGLACPSLDILASAGLGLTGLGLLGPTTLSLNTSTTPNSLLNALNSSVSPLQSPSSGTPSPTLWAPPLANTSSATGFSAIPHLMIPSTAQATLTNILLSGVPTYGHTAPSPPPGLTPVDVHINSMQTEGKKISASLNGRAQSPNIKYGAISTSSLGEKVLSGNHSDPSRQTTGPEQASPKSNPAEGCNDAFVEVGMPRSPSHSGNAGDLKQMMGPSKVSCAKRQTVELLQGTKNSHLHSTDRLLSDPELSAAESPLADKKAPGSERAAERAAAAQQNSERTCLAPRPSYVNMQAFDYEQKKLLATKAMLKKPVVTEVRTPTNTWSGLGFSKSMPAETIKELRRANHVSYKPTMTTTFEGSSVSLSRSNSREHLGSGGESDNWRDRNGIGPTSPSEFAASIGSPKRKQNKSTEHYLSSSNYMDCISSLTGSNGCNLNSSFKGSDLPELFSKLGLGKYTDVFQQQEIDLQTFLTLTDQDLKELGITTFGARRKMLLAISELNKNRRKLFEPPTARTSFLEGGASGRLPRQYHSDVASVSGRW